MAAAIPAKPNLTDVVVEELEIGRPDEEEYRYKPVRWKDFLTKPKYIPFHLLGIAITILSILIAIHHDAIVAAIRPTSLKIRDIPAGFLIPVAILVAISFPPLFGHELVALMCGVVYGLWIGFAVVAAGTLLGEIGTWYAFKYAFRHKAIKLERTNLNYGALARVTREGGFLIVLIIRFSIIPSHFSTAIFSTCNIRFLSFALATFLTLPKQIILVYVGVLLIQSPTSPSSTSTPTSRINILVLALTTLTTVVAGAFIYRKMSAMKKVLLREQEARLLLLKRERGIANANGDAKWKRNEDADFSPEIRLTVDLGRERGSWGGTGRGSGLPPPRKARWEEGDGGSGGVKMVEFI